MELLERTSQLQTLNSALAQARAGQGYVILIYGEAGIGKTSLVERFVAENEKSWRILWGACDALFTPRPLGPLYDIAVQLPDVLAHLNLGEDHRAIFSAFLSELQSNSSSTIIVFEDVHWADEATLDLIKFLGRRISRMASLFILTYREDELGAQDPLRTVLGDLPSRPLIRLPLPPLSESAIEILARRANRSVEGLYSITGGNPFFVTEILASDSQDVPATVRDAVLARASRLSPAAREMLDLASIVPTAVEHWLLQAILQSSQSVFDEVIEHGMLNTNNRMLSFRHELARRAIENLLTTTHAKNLHTKILKALIQRGVESIPLARLVHHATHADDGETVLHYAPVAAQQASALGAHRQAAAQYRTALLYANQLHAERRAEILDSYSDECELTDQMTEAKRAQEEALRLWRELKRPDKEGRALRRLCEIISNLPQLHEMANEMRRYIDDAITVLESLPASKELAMVYSVRSRFHMNAKQFDETLYWGSKAIELAEQLGDIETQAHALNNIGQMEIVIGQRTEGQAKLEHSLQLSLSHGLHYHAARAYLGLATELANVHDYPSALRYFDDGLAYCAQYDLDYWRAAMRAHRSEHLFELGRWTEAEQEIHITQELWRELIEETVSGALRVQVRRGDIISQESVSVARALARNTPLLEFPCHIAAAFAEMAWLHGDLAQCRAEAESMFQIACQRDAPNDIGYLAYWMWRAGAIDESPSNAAEPYALQIAGNWGAAAATWEKYGCPYEQAMALMDGGETAQLAALKIFERLGARPAVEKLKQKMQAEGIRGIPRGPRPATRKNPFGLTAREMEVLSSLVKGLSNNAIAKQYSLSTRTVEHHIAAVLAKLEVESRSEAIAVALQHHLLDRE